jgi:hypothetical protein
MDSKRYTTKSASHYFYINNITNNPILPVITEDKTMAFISGCYCPPHRGHFNTWQTACHDLDLDVLFITSLNVPYETEEYDRKTVEDKNKVKKIQPSYKSRHGIPLEFTEWVVSNWSSQLKNKKNEQVTVVFSSTTPGRLITNNFRQLYLIDGNEGDGDEYSDIYNAYIASIKQKRTSDLDEPDISYWGKKNGITNEKLNDTNTYPMWRISRKNYWRDTTKRDNPSDSPSATKFSLCIKNIKKKEHDPSVCFNFLPDFMSDYDKQIYIDKIIDEYYTDEIYQNCINFNKIVKKNITEEEIKENCGKYDFTTTVKKYSPPKSRKRKNDSETGSGFGSLSPKSRKRKNGSGFGSGSGSFSPKSRKHKGGSKTPSPKSRKRKGYSKTVLRKKSRKYFKRK